MPGLRLNDIMRDKKQSTIKTPMGDLAVTYRPHALTSVDIAEVAQAVGMDAHRKQIEKIVKCLVDWDLVGPLFDPDTGFPIVGEDEPIPITPEVLQFVSLPLLGSIFGAVMRDANPTSTQEPSTNSSRLFEGSFN